MTNNNLEKPSIANKVIHQIKDDKIKMRPKIYFLLKTLAIALGIFFAALFILYLISFIIFALRASGVWYLPCFGLRGIGASFLLLPWLLIAISVILIVILEILVKHFAFAYRKPVLYSILFVVIFALFGSFMVDRAGLQSGLFKRAEQGNLPFAGEFYRDLGKAKNKDARRGIVSEITDNGFLIKTRNNDALEIIVTPETRFPFDEEIKENDTIIVFGKRDNGSVQAIGIRKVDDDFRPLDMLFNKSRREIFRF
jgi:hypothetical protein